MFDLMRKDTPYEWGLQQNAAFHELKQALCEDPVLVAANTDLPFILDMDASNTGLGAVLSQLTPDGEWVVAYHSRTLDKSERNYCVTPTPRWSTNGQGGSRCVGPCTSRGNRFMLVAIDYFTKWMKAYPLPDQEATTVAEALIQGMFSRFGMPSEIHSDQGRNFESQLFTTMCSQLGIRKTRTTPLHPKSDGLVERFMRTLGAQLALASAPDQGDWDLQLPLIPMACRSAVQESTGCTPALLMLGRELRTPPELAYGRPTDAPDVMACPETAFLGTRSDPAGLWGGLMGSCGGKKCPISA
ncbi:hypothetical protein F2P81_009518 [Scophthalmus maximus]|uniref:Integrase catalytic domain-containing protein n=1 Tax=Scophthalmus maximus TaxID=52904 RepID=A0A6A4T763_SCOMX|nr:hypothetical protein F2P81_009518 [Scophthalmus maximus]